MSELRELLGPSGEPDLLPITGLGMRDSIDVWFASVADNGRLPRAKRAARFLLKSLKATTRITLVPTLTLALKRPT